MYTYILINRQEADALQDALQLQSITSEIKTIHDQGRIFYEISIHTEDEENIKKAMDSCGLSHAENIKAEDATSKKYKIGGLLLFLLLLLLIAYAYDKFYLSNK